MKYSKFVLFIVGFNILWTVNVVAASSTNYPDFTQLVETYGKSVVNISSFHKAKPQSQANIAGDDQQIPEIFRRFFGEIPFDVPDQTRQSLGSGFIVSEDGYVITNNHVVADADEVMVSLEDRRELVAQVVGTDPRSDLALLKIKAKGLPAVKIGHSRELKVGEWVLAIGSPYGFTRSATAGIVSAKDRSLPNDNYVSFIQTDVAINPGNSGGPLFNLQGEVVGVNSQIYSRTGGFMGLSFAIPMDIAMEVISQIREQGKVERGWLGVSIQEVNRDLAESLKLEKPAGALISSVQPDGPAAQAGLKAGDLVINFEGQDLPFAAELPPLVGRKKPGTEVTLKIIREGAPASVKVKVGLLPETPTLAQNKMPQPLTLPNKIGIEVADLNAQEKQQLQVPSGILVTRVYGGFATKVGLKPRDVIVLMNYKPVNSVADFMNALRLLKSGQVVPIQIYRQGSPLFIPIRIE